MKTLTSPYKQRKYERKSEPKDRAPDAPKERKPQSVLKIQHHEEFFENILSVDTPILEFLLDSFLEAKSQIFETSLERFLDTLFLKTEFKSMKDMMAIFEKKWKFFSDNRQEYLGEDLSKVKTMGIMVQILARVSKSDEFKTYMIDKKFTSDLIRILQNIEDEFYSHTMFKKLTNARRIILIKLKEAIFEVFINLCDHDIGIIKSDNTSQEYGHLLENIPSISEIQDMLKVLIHELNTANDLVERLNILRGENAQQGDENATTEMNTEDEKISDECVKTSVGGLVKALKIIENLAKNVVGQYILLNTEYSKIIRNPTPIIYFNDFYASLIQLASLLVFKQEGEEYSLAVVRILQSFLYCVYLLCYNPLNNQIQNSEKRKAALKALLLKNKTIKLPNAALQAGTINESLDSLAEIIGEKKRELLENRFEYASQLGSFNEMMSSFDVILFNVLCLSNFLNSNPDHKKENEKIYVDMDHPKELEQKFKDVEEKEASKEFLLPLLNVRDHTNGPHKLSIQAMSLIDNALNDFFVKPNQPLQAWKKGRIHTIARDQLNITENRISCFKYSHLNDFEVQAWDYDGSITGNKKKLEVANALARTKPHFGDGKHAYKLSENVAKHLLDLFGKYSIFGESGRSDLFANEVFYQLEFSKTIPLDIDEKPLIPLSNYEK